MSNSFASAFDAMAAPLFTAAGVADAATYTPCNGSAVECTVLIDRSVQYVGETSQRPTPLTTITAYLAELGRTPKRGDTFVIGSETFTVDAPAVSKDESRVVCTVKPGE